MADQLSTYGMMTNYRPAQNGYSGVGQTQMLSGENAVATLSSSTDKGGMRGIALVAMAIAEIALKQKVIDLGQNYFNINQQDYAFFANRHQPQMAQSATEAFSQTLNPTYQYDYYASLPGGIASTAVNERQWYEARRRLPKYNIGQQRRLDYDMAITRLHAVASGWNMGTRYELTWADQHNLRAYDRKLAVANIGLGIASIVRQGLASAVGEVSQAYDTLGDSIAAMGNGYSEMGGFNAGRQQARKMYGVPGMGMQ
jgi:hypothetical protein